MAAEAAAAACTSDAYSEYISISCTMREAVWGGYVELGEKRRKRREQVKERRYEGRHGMKREGGPAGEVYEEER